MGDVGEEAGQRPVEVVGGDVFGPFGPVVPVPVSVPAPGSVAVTPVCKTGETGGLWAAGVGLVQDPPPPVVCVPLVVG